uniref:non-specific serine/threonine protein kinase n=1 Tax=Aceria tosichella TaxID=561515 RepID=A0A6G1SKG8_9ACAR
MDSSSGGNKHLGAVTQGVPLNLSLDCLGKQLSLPPFMSFLRLNFCRVISYILLDKSITDSTTARPDIDHLECLLEELRTSFDAICDQDHHELVKLCDRNKLPAKADRTRRGLAKNIDPSFILNWGLIETAKYCLVQKLAPEKSTTHQFLTLLKDELSKAFRCDNQFNRLTLLRFLQYLDKIILDRTSDSSDRKHTLSVAENVEHFIDANKDILRTWFFKNRQVSARLALALGDPAECWRCISYRLWSDMTTKYSTIDQQSHDPLESTTINRISVSQTLMSLDTKQWRSNLDLFALSARELGDVDLLYGLKSLVNFSGLLGDHWDLIDLIISNLESNYAKTYDDFMKAIEASTDPTKIDQQGLLEFLDACIELDKLTVQSDKIALLHSPNLKFLYEKYLESTTSAGQQAKSRYDQVKSWLCTWSFEPSAETGSFETIPVYINLAIPTLANNASRIECEAPERNSMIEEIRAIIRPQSTGKLILDGYLDDTATLDEFLKLIVDAKMTTKSDNVNGKVKFRADKQHQLLHRLLRDSGVVELTKTISPVLSQHDIDLIQLKAVKFHLKHRDTEYALKLATDLDARTSNVDDWVRYSSKLKLIEATNSDKNLLSCHNLIETISLSNTLDDSNKNYLLSKVLCRVWQDSHVSLEDLCEQLELVFDREHEARRSAERSLENVEQIARLEKVISKPNIPIETLAMVAKILDAHLNSGNDPSLDLLNASFKMDLLFLSRTGDAEPGMRNKQNVTLTTAVRILDKIKKYGPDLDASNLALFSSQAFIDSTIGCVWFGLRSSVISLITCCHELPLDWMNALVLIIKSIATTCPESILFETLVNRLDLQSKLVDSDARMSPSHRLSEASILLQPDTNSSTIAEQKLTDSLKPENCRRQLKFWCDIYAVIINNNDDDSDGRDDQKLASWRDQVLETEAFLKEIRKISYLPGEYLKTLTTRLNRRLQQYLNLFKKYASPKTGQILNQKHLDDCRAKLDAIYRHDSKSIEVFRKYLEGSFPAAETRTQVTIYDSCLSNELCGPLKELDYRFKLLANKKMPTFSELEMLIKSITELLSLCRAKVTTVHQYFKQKLYLEQISPFLSRLKPNLVLMPGFYINGGDDGGGQCSLNYHSSRQAQPITIHKIGQSVLMIHSKTAPKKLTFTGSDGHTRSYLLKAHEDLRLDKLIMELFGSINLLLGSDKRVREYNYKLQRYSVTPVSNRSGLIQWIEGSSLCSFYRSWFQSANGRRIVGQLYKETCPFVCPDPMDKDEEKHNCIPSQPNQTIDPFYQLLWAKIRSLPRRGAAAQASLYGQVARPSSETTLKYRKEFPASVYEEVVERLVTILPQDLIAHQLWFNSPHSMGYYLRTREFIRSCAAISMVGYVIGLGDRHPDNILLNSKTGHVTHIDYNICFEVGHRLSVAERVPFRLTQSMIHAFGFAGLEGGFKRSCERILDLMKEFKSIILHHLDPINLSFMIAGGGGGTAGAGLHVDDLAGNELVRVADHCQAQPTTETVLANNKVVTVDGAFRRAFSDLSTTGRGQSATSKRVGPQLNLRSQEDDGSATSLELAPTNYNSQQQQNQPGESKSNTITSNIQSAGGSPLQNVSHNQEAVVNQSSPNQVQFEIKTPTMISSKHASDIYGRVQSKLSGNDELLLSQMYAYQQQQQQHAKNGDARRQTGTSKSSDAGQAEGCKRTNEETSNEDLILLIDEVQSTEDQTNALILEAISNKNKAAMFEGWSPWV